MDERENLIRRLGVWGEVHIKKMSWRDRDGSIHTIHSDMFRTAYGAKFSALRMAVKLGYTRPKWWQYWRWNEQRRSEWPTTGFELLTNFR
jgi:hypothetical protein